LIYLEDATPRDVFQMEVAPDFSEDATIVWINQQGLVSVNGAIMPLDAIKMHLNHALVRNPDQSVFLVAHPDVSFGELLSVRDTLLTDRYRHDNLSQESVDYIGTKFYVTT